MGCYERTLALLIEKYAGAFPTWLAPVQVKILPIADAHADYAYELEKELSAKGVRAEVDSRNEKVGYKIRQAQMEKVPYMLIVGEKEVEEKTVSVRSRKEGDKGVRLVMVIGDAENMHREETVNQQDILNTFLKSYDERMYSKLLLVGRKIGTQSCDYVIRHLIDEYVPESEDADEIRKMFEDSRRSDFGRPMHEGGPYRRTMRNSMNYLDKKENKQLNLFGDGQDEDRNV